MKYLNNKKFLHNNLIYLIKTNLFKSKFIYSSLLLYILSIIYFIYLYINMRGRFFWLDEITTFNISMLPNFSEVILQAKNETGQPPLFYLAGRLWSIFGITPQTLRILPFLFFCFTYTIYFSLIRKNKLAQIGLFIYFSNTPMTQYLMTEFRPYSLSLFLLSSYFYFIKKNESKFLLDLKNEILICISLVLFSTSLSLNIPLGIFLILTNFYRNYINYDKNIKSNAYISSIISNIISLSLVVILLYFVTTHDPSIRIFNIKNYVIAVGNAYDIVRNDILTNPNLIILVILTLSYLYNHKKYIIFIIIIFILFYSIFFPVFVLHNRIPWFSSRYSHIAFLLVPVLISYTKILNNNYKSYVLGLLILTTLLLLGKINKFNFHIDENGANSQWVKSFQNTNCKNSEILYLVSPSFIDRVPKLHFSLANMNGIRIIPLEDYNKQNQKFKCIVLAASQKINKNEKDIILLNKYKIISELNPNRDWPENLDNYILFKSE